MAFKHYDLVSARTKEELRLKLEEKIGEGWQPYGPMSISLLSDMDGIFHQPVAAEGDVSGDDISSTVVSEPEYYYVVVLAGQSNGMAYGEGLPLPDSYDRPDP
ncbi:DUF1737 domain-containing protein, partial [Escherichia coli]